jgi:hypothetical protein
MANVASPMIAQEIIERGDRAWNVLVTTAVNNINSLSGVRVVKQQAMFLASLGRRLLRGHRAGLRRRATRHQE